MSIAAVALLFLLSVPVASSDLLDLPELPPMPETEALNFQKVIPDPPENLAGQQMGPIIQAYEIWDAHYCEITPAPFLCRKCILSDRQFVRILTFEKDGRPVRNYGCQPFENPYLH